MTFAFIAERCSDIPVAVACRVMKVSTSGFYAWLAQPVSDRDWADAQLTNTIVDIQRMSRRSSGSPRVHAELRLGENVRCSRKRVERLMRQAGVTGIHRRRKGQGCTRRDGSQPVDDLVNRAFDPTEPDRLRVMDVTEHPTGEGKVYLAVVLDAFSRRVVGWSVTARCSAPSTTRPPTRQHDPTTHPSAGPGEAHPRSIRAVGAHQSDRASCRRRALGG